MDTRLIELYGKMAQLTKAQCEKDCFKIKGHIGSCCGAEYCDYAINHAKEDGFVITPTDHPKLKGMGPGGCIIPPHYRPCCTLHICDKSLFNPEFYKEYFDLRDQIELLEYEIWQEKKNET